MCQHWDLEGGHGKGRRLLDGVERRVHVGNKIEEGVCIMYEGYQGMAVEREMFLYWGATKAGQLGQR